jgi:hypothetical protein
MMQNVAVCPSVGEARLYRHLVRLANDLACRWLHLAECQPTPELACRMAVLDRKLIQVEARLQALQQRPSAQKEEGTAC